MKKFSNILLILLMLAGITNGQNLTGTDIKQISGITAGTAAASKAVVLDANKDVSSIRNLTVSGKMNMDTVLVGTTQWDAATTDSINGEVIARGTIPSAGLVLAKDLVTTSPLAGGTDNILPGTEADVTLSIADAAADGSTKGAAAFATNDFDATNGVVSIDYTNGTAAATGVKGFLTGTDWDTFNGKADNNSVVRSSEVWVTSASQNPALVTLPANATVLSVDCGVSEAFTGDGTDLVSVGYDGALTEYCTDIDVATTGVKTATLGATAKTVDATSQAVEVYYTNGGSEPDAGKAHIVITWIQSTVSP